MNLEDTIKKMLAEAAEPSEKPDTKQPISDSGKSTEEKNAEIAKGKDKVTKPKEVADTTSATSTENMTAEAKVEETCDKDGKKKKDMKKMSEEVSALLESEGLSEDFKLKATTIFEAAVADKALQIQEELKTEYKALFEEEKKELNSNIDEYLNEAVAQWTAKNEVAITANFRTRIAESFMDGLVALLQEHNVEIAPEAEDALEVALDTVEELEEALATQETTMKALAEEVASMKAEKILESFKPKMTDTEFDRFAQLAEGISFSDADQYTKKLNIVLENFSVASKTPEKTITEEVKITPDSVKSIDESVAGYAKFIASGKRQTF